MLQLVVFSLGSEEYGLPITQVQEIIRYSRPRSIPSAPAGIRGVINLRGRIIPVCDLKARLGLEAALSAEAKIVIVETGAVTAGLVVDDVQEVLTVDEEQVEVAPTSSDGSVSSVVKVADRLLVLLDLEALFSGPAVDVERMAV